MPLFMTEAKFTEETLGLMTIQPSDRRDAVAKVIEAHGGKLQNFYWVFGDTDVVFTYEARNNETALAILMALSNGDAVAFHKTRVLISNKEAMAAMRRAGRVKTGYTWPRREWEGWIDEGGEG